MNWLKRLAYLGALLLPGAFPSIAQPFFQEGVLVYRADTVKRLNDSPSIYIIDKLVVYKKASFTRMEVWRINRYNPADIQKHIHIWNRKGSFLFSESSDPASSALPKTALFMTYEGETALRAERLLRGYLKTYTIDKRTRRVNLLGLPAEELTLRENTTNGTTEATVTHAFTIPVESAFDSLGDIPGTPLQFTDKDIGWLTRLTAIDITYQRVPDELFDVDAAYQLISFDEMMKDLLDSKK